MTVVRRTRGKSDFRDVGISISTNESEASQLGRLNAIHCYPTGHRSASGETVLTNFPAIQSRSTSACCCLFLRAMATFTKIPEGELSVISINPKHKISKILDNVYGGFTE